MRIRREAGEYRLSRRHGTKILHQYDSGNITLVLLSCAYCAEAGFRLNLNDLLDKSPHHQARVLDRIRVFSGARVKVLKPFCAKTVYTVE